MPFMLHYLKNDWYHCLGHFAMQLHHLNLVNWKLTHSIAFVAHCMRALVCIQVPKNKIGINVIFKCSKQVCILIYGILPVHPSPVALTTRSPSHAVQTLYAEHCEQLSIAAWHSEMTMRLCYFTYNIITPFICMELKTEE